MAEGVPARIDRAALDRIIRRAAELQTSERDIGDALTPDDVLALGREVGIPARYLQQAILEERTRGVEVTASGLLDRLVGAGQVHAERVVRGDAAAVERTLLLWIEQNELLVIQRHQPGRVIWEPLGGFQATIRRSTAALGGGKRPFMLSRARTASAVITPLEDGFVHVSLDADVRGTRMEYVGGAGAVLGAGATAATILAILTAPLLLALAPVPAALGVGYVIVRQYHPAAQRVQVGLERALDHLEQSGQPAQTKLPPRAPGLLNTIFDEVRRGLG